MKDMDIQKIDKLMNINEVESSNTRWLSPMSVPFSFDITAKTKAVIEATKDITIPKYSDLALLAKDILFIGHTTVPRIIIMINK